MIHISDNNAATQCWSIVGDAGLYAVAQRRGDDRLLASTGSWGTALLSPADQAHFFFNMDSLIPHEFVGYARFLLSTIAAYSELGRSRSSPGRSATQMFFKDGSEPTGARPARAPGRSARGPRTHVLARGDDRRRPDDALRRAARSRGRAAALLRYLGWARSEPSVALRAQLPWRRDQIVPRGPFSLRAAAEFGFGPNEGRAAAVRRGDAAGVRGRRRERLRRAPCCASRPPDGPVEVELQLARRRATRTPRCGQTARIVSLDHDGERVPGGGRARPGDRRACSEPTPASARCCSTRPYEAAAWAIISARTPGRARPPRCDASVERPARCDVRACRPDRPRVSPAPTRLIELPDEIAGLNSEKIARLRGVARGRARRASSTSTTSTQLGPERAYEDVQQLKGLGPFYAGLVVAAGERASPTRCCRSPSRSVLAHAAQLLRPRWSRSRLEGLDEPGRGVAAVPDVERRVLIRLAGERARACCRVAQAACTGARHRAACGGSALGSSASARW